MSRTDADRLQYPSDTYKKVCSCLDAVAALPCLSKILVFGSRIKGTAGPGSDLDVACFFDLPPEQLYDTYKTLVHLCNITETDIQIQAFSTAELTEPAGIIEEIVREGREYFPCRRL